MQNKHMRYTAYLLATVLLAAFLVGTQALAPLPAAAQPNQQTDALVTKNAEEAEDVKRISPDALAASALEQGSNNPQEELAITAHIPRAALEQGESFDEYDTSDGADEDPSDPAADDGLIEDLFYAEDFAEGGYFHEEGLCQLGSYRMFSRSLGTVDIIGGGVTLQSLLESVGVSDLGAIRELRFTNAAGESVTVNWNDIAQGKQSPLVAAESLVVTAEPDAAASGEAPGELGKGQTLLNNTRFRILFDDSAEQAIANADDLRSVNAIEVNPNYQQAENPRENATKNATSPRSGSANGGSGGTGTTLNNAPTDSNTTARARSSDSAEAGSTAEGTTSASPESILALRLHEFLFQSPFASFAVWLLLGGIVFGICLKLLSNRR